MRETEIEVKKIMLAALKERLHEIEPIVDEIKCEIFSIEEDIKMLEKK